AKMDSKSIPFTQHWGKSNAYTPQRVRNAYGDMNVGKWKAAREQLLPDPADQAAFSNAFLRNCGLA
ncbi:MAG: FAD-linked oxidase, partial [Pseudomonadota bacterium]